MVASSQKVSEETLKFIVEDALAEIVNSSTVFNKETMEQHLKYLSLDEEDKKLAINRIRQRFIKILKEKELSGKTKQRIYDSLIEMAIHWPLNDSCPITLLSFTEDDAKEQHADLNDLDQQKALKSENQIFFYTGYRYYNDDRQEAYNILYKNGCPMTRAPAPGKLSLPAINAVNNEAKTLRSEAKLLNRIGSAHLGLTLMLAVVINGSIFLAIPTMGVAPALALILSLTLPFALAAAGISMACFVEGHINNKKADELELKTDTNAQLQSEPHYKEHPKATDWGRREPPPSKEPIHTNLFVSSSSTQPPLLENASPNSRILQDRGAQ
jgi:hypothetical protein